MEYPLSRSSRLLDLPAELKEHIMRQLDARSLLSLGLACKQMQEVLKGSNYLIMQIEMAQSDLIQAMPISSSQAAREFLRAHQNARVEIPIDTSRHVFLDAPPGIFSERIFRGLLASISGTGDSDEQEILHVWDIRRPDPTQTPRKILTLSKPKIFDVVIEPQLDLLVLVLYRLGDDTATIEFLELSSNGTKPHPGARSEIVIRIRPFEEGIFNVRECVWASGHLLAFVYRSHQPVDGHIFRRGIVWNWKTGDTLYDSVNFESEAIFHGLVLFLGETFLVAASPLFTVYDTEVAPEGWVELRVVDDLNGSPATSRLIAQFDLPEIITTSMERSTFHLQFYVGEPPMCEQRTDGNDGEFPFTADPVNAIQVLGISSNHQEAYLVISNGLFLMTLDLLRHNNPNFTFPCRFVWKDWVWWTSLWDRQIGMLSDTSSVCGSRTCSIDCQNYSYEICIVDFNMNIPCSQRDCVDPLIHFSPRTFRPNGDVHRLPWPNVAGLPFHSACRSVVPMDIEDFWVISALMDEERIVLSTCEAFDDDLTRTGWTIVHLLYDGVENPTIEYSHTMPWLGDVEIGFPRVRHSITCRLCQQNPHSDLHILLECDAHPEVVNLRRKFFDGYPELSNLLSQGSFKQLLDEIRARPRGRFRIFLTSLVVAIQDIYEALPANEVVVPDVIEPLSVLFVKRDDA